MNLYDDVKYIKGVGPKKAEELYKCGIFNVLDLLLYFPRDYEYIRNNKYFIQSQINEKVIIQCKVVKKSKDIRTRTGKILTTIYFNDGNSVFKGKWFNQPYIKKSYEENCEYIITGKVQQYGKEKVIVNPKIIRNTSIDKDKIIAKYPLKGKLTNNFFNRVITQILSEVSVIENLPKSILQKYNFCSLHFAVNNIHSPSNYKNLEEAKRRLVFQELFAYSLKILMLKDYINKNENGISFKISPYLKELKEKLPFNLTNAQNKVMREILKDEKRSKSMNRLVQGDVGSGKTIVAIIAIFNAVMNGYQASMMAPTEILARQHYNELNAVLKDYNLNVKLLVGSTTNKNKQIIKEALKNGEIDIIVGTHALIEDDVIYKNLGIVVTDEQHRFGVNQRSRFYNKGKNIDVLVMTATPIPRTLSLYLYGDLDVSIIDELPPGRKKIDTFYTNTNSRERVYKFALETIKEGRQVYVVCPLVEDNDELKLTSVEKLYLELKDKYFSEYNIAILHGKMNAKEKKNIMDSFKNNEIKVLISTTVIEVGVNVPNASLMVIENAERFGLAQLHQLRGRVGRGQYKSYCILIANIKSEITKKRMEIMKTSNDGFFIAEQDLKIRGTGEMFGVRQSGENELLLADFGEDIEVFKIANSEAKKIVLSDDKGDIKVKDEIMNSLQKSASYICFN